MRVVEDWNVLIRLWSGDGFETKVIVFSKNFCLKVPFPMPHFSLCTTPITIPSDIRYHLHEHTTPPRWLKIQQQNLYHNFQCKFNIYFLPTSSTHSFCPRIYYKSYHYTEAFFSIQPRTQKPPFFPLSKSKWCTLKTKFNVCTMKLVPVTMTYQPRLLFETT